MILIKKTQKDALSQRHPLSIFQLFYQQKNYQISPKSKGKTRIRLPIKLKMTLTNKPLKKKHPFIYQTKHPLSKTHERAIERAHFVSTRMC